MDDPISRIEAALEAGPTPGPWRHEAWGSRILDSGVGSSQLLIATVAVNTYRDQGRHNAEFIAACSPDRIERVLAELERLRAELAEARRDAERYRWLRDSKIADDADRWICAHECTLHEVAELDGERLDAAIDRARGAEC